MILTVTRMGRVLVYDASSGNMVCTFRVQLNPIVGTVVEVDNNSKSFASKLERDKLSGDILCF